MNKVKLSANRLSSAHKKSEQFDPVTGGVLVLTEQPTGVEFGVDCICYETGPRFRGLSGMPAGLHFIYYGTGMGARQGYFIYTKLKEVVVHTWDSANEQIIPSNNLSPDSLGSLQDALYRGALNAELGPYPMDQYSLWKRNSSYISQEVLRAADCSCGTLLYPGDETSIFSDEKVLDSSSADPKRYKSVATSSSAVSGAVASTATFLDLKQVEAQLVEQVPRHDPVARAKLVTHMMMDKSALLQHLVARHFGSTQGLLGDLQLSFLLFMLLYSFPALQHWKALVYAICSSETLLRAQPAFAAAFMRCFYLQLDFAPVDFFESELSKENFLRPIIVTLFHSLDSRVEGDGDADAAVEQRWEEDGGDEEPEHEEEADELLQSVEEHKKRLFHFLRKKFNLFDSVSSILSASPSNASSTSASASASVKLSGSNLDSFTLMEEDQPTFVSQREILDLQEGAGGVVACPLAKRQSANPLTSGVFDMSDVGTNPCDARWAATEQQLGHLRRAFGMTETVNSVSALPVEDMELSDEQPPEVKGSAVSTAPMTALELEIAQFNWRYPLIFGALQRSTATGQYCEDFTMAAMRLLEEAGDLDRGDLSSTALEAMKFVEEEVARMR